MYLYLYPSVKQASKLDPFLSISDGLLDRPHRA
jgi:hypothetical protein